MKRVLFLILFLSLAMPTHAQEPTPVPDASRGSSPGDAGPAPVTYVVKPGDTLYRIAQEYGVTIEAIVAANDIADPSQIVAGQKLIIPTGLAVTGQAAPPPISPSRRVHPVRPGETLPSLAFRYGTTALALRDLNGLHRHGLLVPGQELIIPPPAVPAIRDRRFPKVSIRPAPAVQGQTIFVAVESDASLKLSGSFLDEPLAFVRDRGQYWALFGLDVLTPPGAYPLDLLAVEASTGDQITMQEILTVTAGSFPTYNIVVPASRQNLLDPDLSRIEREKVEEIFARSSPWRLFAAPFSYPLAGELQPTSPFGQRRSYSGGPVSSYHSGQDYAAAVGVPVYAPARGVVVLAEPLDVRGQAIILDHGWGVFSGFWHLSQIDVRVGQQVDRGEVIGLVGNTGLSTGAHLHWEMQVRGVPVDPVQWTKESFPEPESRGNERFDK
ncbi:MAG: LysM peptidoglycan-binding domain-containing protein [Anaerolineae bacterium]|nr:LysM peptidoglycan-binding domain-containing protein [Anaerolineae bacterium]